MPQQRRSAPGARTPAKKAARGPAARRASGKTRAALTREGVLEATIRMLDKQGEEKLTLRGLAAELGSGVASIYWYAENKDQLLDVATGEIISRAVADYRRGEAGADADSESTRGGEPAFQPDPDTSAETADALNEVRKLILSLYRQMEMHPWLPIRLMRSDPDVDGSLEFWEQLGRPLQRTTLSVKQQLTATMTLMNYASGTGAENAFRTQMQDSGQVMELQAMGEQVARWKALSAGDFPFVRSVVDVFMDHDDSEQFVDGLDLTLRGIEYQANQAQRSQ